MSGLRRRLITPVLVFGTVVLACAPAAAASETLHVGTIPAAVAGGQPFRLTATGTTSNGQARLAIFGQRASEPCAATAQEDGGIVYIGVGVQESFNETFSSPLSLVHGTYLFCGYVFDGSDNEPLSRDEDALVVANADRVAVTPEPAVQIEGQHGSIALTGYADAEVELYVTFKPAGGGCGANAGVDTGTRVVGPGSQSGEYATSVEAPALAPGAYVVCAWLEPLEAPNAAALASNSAALDISPFRGSVSLAVRAESAFGASTPVSVGYEVNAPSEMFMLVPLTATTCASTWQSETVLGLNPFYDPTTEARSRSLGDQLSGRFGLTLPPPPRPGRYVACAWLQAGGAGAGPFSTSFVSLPPGQLPTPPRSHGTPFRGRTSQRLEIVLAYAHARISDLAYEALFRCTHFHALVRERTELPAFRVAGRGRFTHPWRMGTDRGTIHGAVHGARITGTLTETYRSQAGSTCRTPSVAFSATAR
jgi:hypothetical protein